MLADFYVLTEGSRAMLIAHDMPPVSGVADRIHIHRLGRRACVIRPADYSVSDAVAIMTGP